MTIISLICLGLQGLAQISNVEYGKNRVQFHDDFDSWYRYETANFITHWYGKARANSDFTIKMAEHDFNELERILEHHINDKIEILVYTDVTDLKQSNIGLEEAFINTDDRTKVSGRYIFVYYDGDHVKLRRQIREGIAEVYINDMIHGGNLRQLVQNAISSDLPIWYRDGIISYLGEKWNPQKETDLIHLFRNNKHKEFDDLSHIDPRLVGNLMWYFLAQQYGHGAVSNILYISRLNRDLEENFVYIFGQSLDQIKEAAYNFASDNILKNHNGRILSDKNHLKIKNSKKGNFSDVQFSPDGNKIIYTINEIGKVKVYVQDIKSGEHKLLFKNGYRNIFQATDFNYPVIAWNNDGSGIYLIYEHRDVLYLRLVETETGAWAEEPLSPEYQRIYSLDYIEDNLLLLNGTANGFNNLFLYLPKTRESRRLNNDFYDDRDATFGYLNGERGVLYSSNRPDVSTEPKVIDTILPINQSDIFFMTLDNYKNYQLTDTPEASERNPKFIDSTSIQYTTDASGMINHIATDLSHVFTHNLKVITLNNGTVHTIHQDSTLANVDIDQIQNTEYKPIYKWISKRRYLSDLSQELIDSDINVYAEKIVEVVRVKQEDRIYIRSYKKDQNEQPNQRWYKSAQGATQLIRKKETKNLQGAIKDTLKEKIPVGLLFKSEFPDPIEDNLSIEEDINQIDQKTTSAQSSVKKIDRINFSRILGSRLTFHVDDVDFKFDNELLFDGLQNYASADNGDLITQPFGLLLKMRVKDLLEDYSAEVGVRYPTSFSGSEYFLVVDNNKKRIDKRYAYYRRANTGVVGITQNRPAQIKQKRITNTLLTRWKYPFDIYRSARATFTFRTDNDFLLNSERRALETDNNLSQRFGLKLEYVFDNSLQYDYNIIHGTRYKFFGEIVNKTEIAIIDDWRFKPNNGVMAILGLDARHYQRLDRRTVLAVRAAGATSFGSEKILYYLGGVENWLFPDRNNIIPIPSGDDFAYQGLGVQMRGFNQNIRNGNSYALINSELRIPIFQYLKKYRLRSAFLRNFIITGFFDAGTAWQGSSPFSDDNPLNVTTISNDRTVLRINFFRDPIVYGYGVGARTYLFGYNLKFDYGWGVDSGTRNNGVFYFSLGKDF